MLLKCLNFSPCKAHLVALYMKCAVQIKLLCLDVSVEFAVCKSTGGEKKVLGTIVGN